MSKTNKCIRGARSKLAITAAKQGRQ